MHKQPVEMEKIRTLQLLCQTALTLKQPGNIFQNFILIFNIFFLNLWYFCTKLVQCSENLIWTVNTDGQGPVLLTFLRHVARISANGIAAFKESCSPIG